VFPHAAAAASDSPAAAAAATAEAADLEPAASQPLGLKAQVVPHAAVEAYVWGVVRRVVPPALLGSRHNQQVGMLVLPLTIFLCICAAERWINYLPCLLCCINCSVLCGVWCGVCCPLHCWAASTTSRSDVVAAAAAAAVAGFLACSS
jgi:hypothetical protein